MFGCNDGQQGTNPTEEQKKIHDNQSEFFKEKVEGKESVTAKSCDSYWGTNLRCAAGQEAIMVIQWSCDGDDASGTEDVVKEGACSTFKRRKRRQ